VAGVFLLGALSGFGVMASQAAAELVAAHVLEQPLPGYAPAFLPGRFDDPSYIQGLTRGDARHGQL
jgi:glycine/D-amino acid oxidase-like deaminating enzyme